MLLCSNCGLVNLQHRKSCYCSRKKLLFEAVDLLKWSERCVSNSHSCEHFSVQDMKKLKLLHQTRGENQHNNAQRRDAATPPAAPGAGSGKKQSPVDGARRCLAFLCAAPSVAESSCHVQALSARILRHCLCAPASTLIAFAACRRARSVRGARVDAIPDGGRGA